MTTIPGYEPPHRETPPQADVRLRTIAAAAWAMAAAGEKARTIAEALRTHPDAAVREGGKAIEQLMGTISVAGAELRGQLNWFTEADSPRLVERAQTIYRLDAANS